MKHFAIWILTALAICLSSSFAQHRTYDQDEANLQIPITILEQGWKYHNGDNQAWANPDFDDSSWETMESTKLLPGQVPHPGWEGIGWFRLHFKLDPSTVGQ